MEKEYEKKQTNKKKKKQRRILGNNVSIYLIRLKRGSNLGYISELWVDQIEAPAVFGWLQLGVMLSSSSTYLFPAFHTAEGNVRHT